MHSKDTLRQRDCTVALLRFLPECKFLQKLKAKLTKLGVRGIREVFSNVSPISKFLFMTDPRKQVQYHVKDFDYANVLSF